MATVSKITQTRPPTLAELEASVQNLSVQVQQLDRNRQQLVEQILQQNGIINFLKGNITVPDRGQPEGESKSPPLEAPDVPEPPQDSEPQKA